MKHFTRKAIRLQTTTETNKQTNKNYRQKQTKIIIIIITLNCEDFDLIVCSQREDVSSKRLGDMYINKKQKKKI
jgi:hypothetical protein